MSGNKRGILLVLLVVTASASNFVCGCLAGRGSQRQAILQEAISQGAGKWVINEETGERFFIWTGREDLQKEKK